jgi:hypothetical protein
VNRPLPETLDEAIDRVAAAMTAVPADPGFGARLVPRLDAPARGVSTWMVAAAAAAAIILSVWLVRPERSAVRPPQQASANQPAAPAVGPAPGVRAAEAPTATARPPMLATAAPAEPVAPIERTPVIAALGPVETLTVDDLTLHELMIAPVDVAHLDIETLDVPEIGTTDEPKE